MSNRTKNRDMALLLSSLVFLMLALTYASVPLYRLFCQITGYAGTPRLGGVAPTTILERTMTVHFDGSVNRDMVWEFHPLQNDQTLKIGQTGLAYFEAYNPTSQPITGTATFNVTPDKVARYFHKTLCFCFEEQTLQPYSRVRFPVQYYLDPSLASDPKMKDVTHVTLSYTFFKAKGTDLDRVLKNSLE